MFLVEAMSQGRIWISTDRDGMRDLAIEGGGFLVAPEDVGGLAGAIGRLATLPSASRDALEAESCQAWARFHQPEVVADRYASVYWP